MYSKIKQGRKFVYHSTSHFRSHKKGYHFSKIQSYANGKKCVSGRTRREGKKPLCSSAFSLQIILKYCFCISRNTLASKFKALEKNETIGCMMHCYKIEFNFLQKKFSKHLLRNISCECLYCEIKCIKGYVTRKI